MTLRKELKPNPGVEITVPSSSISEYHKGNMCINIVRQIKASMTQHKSTSQFFLFSSLLVILICENKPLKVKQGVGVSSHLTFKQ